MKIHQFYDEGFAQAGYAVVSEGEIAVMDPARNPDPYYNDVRAEGGKIVAIIETYSYADFVSGHLEIHQKTGAILYASAELAAQYPHKDFDSGEVIKKGKSGGTYHCRCA
jgi:hydroxyacylglutathione hydrolase